jgi:hypothetical protein
MIIPPLVTTKIGMKDELGRKIRFRQNKKSVSPLQHEPYHL